MQIPTPWPDLRLYARDGGEINPYAPENGALFRGEEAFEDEMTGWRRWSKPSPEPLLDADFEAILLDSIQNQAPTIAALARELARKIGVQNAEKAPVLVAILRAGAPICALLAPLLSSHFNEKIPICALSLFAGLGWDETALEQITADFPDRTLIFVDGWTSGGGVAVELRVSFARWIAKGKADFTRGKGPQLAVLCDPRGVADLSAVRADVFVPSSCFTAPETLGFSRGFARKNGGLFGVYRFPSSLLRRNWIEKWLDILQIAPAELPLSDELKPTPAPGGFRIHSNEVTRALINRSPREVWLRDDEKTAQKTLAPMLHLAKLRGVPVEFDCLEIAELGALAIARMSE